MAFREACICTSVYHGSLDHPVTLAGLALGASGLGAFMWGWIFPWISHRVGRKPTLLFVALLSTAVPLTYQVSYLVAHPWLMATAGFIGNGGQGIAALTFVLIPSETYAHESLHDDCFAGDF